MPSSPFYAFYGHHKCATMWLNRILSSVCNKLALKFEAVYDEEDFGRDIQKYVTDQRIDFLSYGNADLSFVESLGQHRAFHVIRDPRDIVVSAYFSHMRSHSTDDWPELIKYRDKLNSVSKNEGLALEIENRAREFHHLSSWDYAQEDILEIRFEELVAQSYEHILRILDHLQLVDESDYRWTDRARTLALELLDFLIPASARSITRAIKPAKLSGAEVMVTTWRNRFQAQTAGRKQGQENLTSHYRKGQPGDWQNHFQPEHKTLFKELYPGLLTTLGYEDSDDW